MHNSHRVKPIEDGRAVLAAAADHSGAAQSGQRLPVRPLVDALPLAQSTVSEHLK